MKFIKTTLVSVLLTSNLMAQAEHEELMIGEKLPMSGAFMIDVHQGETTLNNQKQKNGLIVVFTSNRCPFVTEWEKDYGSLFQLATKNKLGMVLINSNEKFRDKHESIEEMRNKSIQKGYDFVPYLVDRDSKLANKLGAKTTPHIYYFDKNLKLIYKGSIDDRYEGDNLKITQTYLKDAISQATSAKEIENPETRQIGCSIKRK